MKTMFFNPWKGPPAAGDAAKKKKKNQNNRSLWSTMLKETVARVDPIISKWDPDGSPYSRITSIFFFYDGREEARRFFIAVSDLRRAMQFSIAADRCAKCDSTSVEVLSLAERLVGTAMKRLRKEFYMILESLSRDSAAGSLYDVGEGGEEERLPTAAMGDLRDIAECMVKNGCGEECVKVYRLARRSVVGESLYYRHGFERKKLMVAGSHIQKLDWDSLEQQMMSWRSVCGVAIKTIFSGERFLSDYIFNFSNTLKELCFSETTRDTAETFLAFPSLIAGAAKSNNILSPEKVFRFLDLYSTLSDHLGDIKTIFSSYRSMYTCQTQAAASVNILGESIRSMLLQFESAIKKDSSKSLVPGGGVHPLTRYVMNYLVFIGDYITVLSDIYADHPLPKRSPLPETFFQSTNTTASSSPISRHTSASAVVVEEEVEEDRCYNITGHPHVASRLAWILLVLLCKLDGKADFYKNASLSYLFLSNNLLYIVQKVRGSKLRHLLGEEWMSENEEKATCYMKKYVRGAWRKVVEALPKVPATVGLEAAKKMMEEFNSAFEEACGVQSGWVVEDARMREKVKNSIGRNVVGPYRVFYDVWCLMLRVEMSYSPEELGIFTDMVISGRIG